MLTVGAMSHHLNLARDESMYFRKSEPKKHNPHLPSEMRA